MPRVLLLIALCLLAVPSAAAASPREEARAFADAALKAKASIDALGETAQTEMEELAPCLQVAMKAPRRVADEAGMYAGLALMARAFGLATATLRTFVTDLEAIRTSDPALRAGRMAWRRTAAGFEALPQFEDPCGVLTDWRDGGWKRADAPEDPEQQLAVAERAAGGRLAAQWLEVSAKRLTTLGVGKRGRRAFSGSTTLDGVLEPFFEAILDAATGGPKPVR